MHGKMRLLAGAMLGMIFMAVALLFGARVANAQIGWNPPCPTITFVNRTNCSAKLTLQTNPPGAIPGVIVPAGAVVGPLGVPPGTVINGLFSNAGIFYPVLLPAPPVPPAPIPATGWVPNVTLGPVPCCFDVYFDLATCTVYLYPTFSPPPCRP